MANDESSGADRAPDARGAAARKTLAGQGLLLVVAAAVALLTWRLAGILTVALGAVVLSIALRGLARLLSRAVPIGEQWAVVPVVLLLSGAFAAVAWLFGANIDAQFDILVERLPQTLADLERALARGPLGHWLLGQVQGVNLPNATGALASHIGAFFTATLRGAAYAVVMVAAGVYFAMQPQRYRGAVLQLVPPRLRARAAEILDFAGETLQRWLVGQCLTMLAVGLLSSLGLWALGVSAPLALGLISGTFAFVPYVGPLAAAGPAVLMALTQSPWLALYTALLYAGVHVVEGDVITPLVQNETVRLPPALTIFAAAIFGTLLGAVGVLLAAPLTILLLVGVQTLYIEGVLGERRSWP
ncbi:MAG: AI-2E family transporter [Nevskia sp.]|nr:AI-2E family transporter [Nevskia sp.]